MRMYHWVIEMVRKQYKEYKCTFYIISLIKRGKNKYKLLLEPLLIWEAWKHANKNSSVRTIWKKQENISSLELTRE